MHPRKIVQTEDGSATIFVAALGEHYHSIHGAIQESRHVFIRTGLRYIAEQIKQEINILEIGMGTGLNAFLTLKEAERMGKHVSYLAIEKYPLQPEEYIQLHYAENEMEHAEFLKIHQLDWEQWHEITPYFSLYKSVQDIRSIRLQESIAFNLIYFDAFAPDAQPELWETAIFKRIHALSCKGSVLVTYCSKGQVRRNMQSAGWKIEKLPGPPGKREMVRATIC